MSSLPPNIKRVLFADDTADTRTWVRRALEQAGIEADFAADGIAALGYGASREYDLIILDAAMPNLSGYEVTERLQKIGVTTPIKLFTADQSAIAKAHAQSFKVDIWEKPMEPAELVKRIQEELCE